MPQLIRLPTRMSSTAASTPAAAAIPTDNDTTLFGYRAKRIGDLKCPLISANVINTMCTAGKKTEKLSLAILNEILCGINLPQVLTEESYIYPYGNYNDGWALIFDKTSKVGLWITDTDGVWSLTGGEYGWEQIQNLDLVCTLIKQDDGTTHLTLSALK